MVRKGDRMLAQKFGTGLARGFFIKGTLRPIIRHYVHPRVTGLENLSDLDPPLILAANHSSHMDTPLILNSLPRELRRRTLVAAASDYFFASRLLGTFVSVAVGAVPLDRRFVSNQNLDTVARLLEQNWCLIVYPEGGRTLDGRLYKGRTGIARLALSARAPVIPVGIRGTYGSMPAGRSWPVPGHAEVRFGKPLLFDRYQHGEPSRITLRAITDEVMYQVMALSELSYVDEYVSDVKARKQGTRAGPAETAGGSGSCEPATAGAAPAIGDQGDAEHDPVADIKDSHQERDRLSVLRRPRPAAWTRRRRSRRGGGRRGIDHGAGDPG